MPELLETHGVAIAALSLLCGAMIRAINRDAMTLIGALKGFLTGLAFGSVAAGIVYLFWPVQVGPFWPVWFLLAYVGNLLQHTFDTVSEKLAENPLVAARQVLSIVLKQALSKLENLPK